MSGVQFAYRQAFLRGWAAAAGHRGLQVWDTETGKRLTPEWTPGRGSLGQLAFMPDGRHLVAGYDDGWVAVLQPDGQKVVERQGHEGDVKALAVSPDGRYVVSAADDRTLTVWWPNLKRRTQWVVGDANPTVLAFAPDSRTLAVGDAKGVVQVLDLETVLGELAGLGFRPPD